MGELILPLHTLNRFCPFTQHLPTVFSSPETGADSSAFPFFTELQQYVWQEEAGPKSGRRSAWGNTAPRRAACGKANTSAMPIFKACFGGFVSLTLDLLNKNILF